MQLEYLILFTIFELTFFPFEKPEEQLRAYHCAKILQNPNRI